jgi:hypothetical protein
MNDKYKVVEFFKTDDERQIQERIEWIINKLVNEAINKQ